MLRQDGREQGFGIDIGGTGVKGAPVDLERGELLAARHRVLTPRPATPPAVAGAVAEVVGHFGAVGTIGVAFPAVVLHGVAMTAANIDASWRGLDVGAELGEAASVTVQAVNDADAAGLAEVRFGAGRDVHGVVVMVTLGTGVGTGLFVDGRLVPNTEFGHLEFNGQDAETRVAESARERHELSWEKWGKRLAAYLKYLESLLWPDLIVLGGGASKKFDKFAEALGDVRTAVTPAKLLNEAGIIGAAIHAAEQPTG